jgi:hypothetical protein
MSEVISNITLLVALLALGGSVFVTVMMFIVFIIGLRDD